MKSVILSSTFVSDPIYSPVFSEHMLHPRFPSSRSDHSLWPQFGTVTLGEHYKRIAVEGNDYDPYTTLFAGKKKPTGMIASLLGNSVEMEEEEQPVVK